MALPRFQEVKEALWPVPLDWSEEVENSFHESLDEQEGPVDHVHSPSPGQSLPKEDSGQGFMQQEFHQSE